MLHAFCVVTAPEDERWHDKNGIAYQSRLSAEFWRYSFRTDGKPAEPIGARWSFPCHTVVQARAICERFILTEDRAEMDYRDGLRYPLTWGGSADDYEQWQRALIVRNQNAVAQYRVPDDIR